MTGAALWYWWYHSMEYAVWDDEEEAAGIAAAMEDDGGGVPAGVQFPDGRLIPAAEWEALKAAREAREAAYSAYVPPPPSTRRKVKAPFGGGVIEIGKDEPAWIGVREG